MRFKLILFVLLIFVPSLFSATHLVPSVYPTIQEGIDAALEGDTVLVAPGTYTSIGNSDITFNGVNLVLLSASGAESTIIDIGSELYGIIFENGEDTTSQVNGFSFRNGTYSIFMTTGIANVLNCSFETSQVGIFLEYPTGISSCRISHCRLQNNSGGIYNLKYGTLIDSCTIQNNSNYGIGMYAPTDIRYCLVANNAWVGIMQSSGMNHYPVLVDHCTVVSNGYGIYFDRTLPLPPDKEVMVVDTSLIINTVVAFNDSYGIYNYWDLEAEYNCVYSNVYGNGTNWQNDKYSHGDVFGNVSIDPLFCDTATGDFTLKDNSYCTDGNNPSGSTIGVYDVGCTGGCCIGIRGNVDNSPDDIIDIGDLVYFVDWFFSGGPHLACPPEGDLNVDTFFDIADLVYLVSYMFADGPEPLPCP